MSVPEEPKIYHITHLKNLSGIVKEGGLWSDAQRIARNFETTLVGMSEIKQRRLTEVCVKCYPNTKVGEYVPFYFCPRSIMLYILHRGNHPGICYSGGQAPIVHLQADLMATIRWAQRKNVEWAFSKTNAGSRYCDFFSSLDQLSEVDWDAVANDDFKTSIVKEGKQAEFLVFDWFPWSLVEKIGVIDTKRKNAVTEIIAEAKHQPGISVKSRWYF